MKSNLEVFLFDLNTLYAVGDEEHSMRMLEAMIAEVIAEERA